MDFQDNQKPIACPKPLPKAEDYNRLLLPTSQETHYLQMVFQLVQLVLLLVQMVPLLQSQLVLIPIQLVLPQLVMLKVQLVLLLQSQTVKLLQCQVVLL